jgi:hypothetical protein
MNSTGLWKRGEDIERGSQRREFLQSLTDVNKPSNALHGLMSQI